MRREIEKDLMPLCARERVAIVPYFGLASGFLTGKYRSAADKSKSPRGAGMDKYLDAKGLKVLAALDAFGDASLDSLAIDLGCGDGRDVVEILRRGWNVVAVDAEPPAYPAVVLSTPLTRSKTDCVPQKHPPANTEVCFPGFAASDRSACAAGIAGALTPFSEQTLMIRPQCCAFIWGKAARIAQKLAFTDIVAE